MFRESLEQDRGMLFVFENTDQYSFHMKNTFIPLDIAFINEEGIIESIKELDPMNPIPVYPDGEIRYAVEVNRGWFAENGVEVGDILLEDTEETEIDLTSSSGFDTAGTIFIENEEITYTGISTNTLTGCTRGANGTTAATHDNGTSVAQFDNGAVPRFIVRTLDNNFLLFPFPNRAYTLKFDYFAFPTDLSAQDSTTTIPARFDPVIIDGATAFVYQYRGETTQYQLNFSRFEQGIKNMQSLLVNKYEYVRSTVIQQPTGYFSSGALN